MNKDLKIDRDMLIFGVRYALGRQTFAPTIAVENVRYNIDKLDDITLELIIKDIEFQKGMYGMECDKLTWINFKTYLEKTLSERKTGEL